jgi:hypothetical protein
MVSVPLALRRVLTALSGDIVGFIPAALLVGAFCIVSMGLAGVTACIFVLLASSGLLLGTLIPAGLGFGTHFRGHLLLGASTPFLALFILYPGASAFAENFGRFTLMSAAIIALATFLIELFLSRILKWQG